MPSHQPAPRLIAISPGDWHRRDPMPYIEALGRAGLPALLVREPGLEADALRVLGMRAWAWIPLIVSHDRMASARDQGSPIHLAAHGELGDWHGPWSRSCHDEAEVDAALAAGASWVTWSPVFRPTSKPADRRPVLGEDRFLAHARGRPVLALGGIDAERLARLCRAGAYGAAVQGALFGAPDPLQAARRCEALLEAIRA